MKMTCKSLKRYLCSYYTNYVEKMNLQYFEKCNTQSKWQTFLCIRQISLSDKGKATNNKIKRRRCCLIA